METVTELNSQIFHEQNLEFPLPLRKKLYE